MNLFLGVYKPLSAVYKTPGIWKNVIWGLQDSDYLNEPMILGLQAPVCSLQDSQLFERISFGVYKSLYAVYKTPNYLKEPASWGLQAPVMQSTRPPTIWKNIIWGLQASVCSLQDSTIWRNLPVGVYKPLYVVY